MNPRLTRIERQARRALFSALIAYVLMLQGLVSAYAQTAMAASVNDPAFVICSPLGTADEHPDHPLKDLARDCCSTLCQVAASLGPSLIPDEPAAFPLPARPSETHGRASYTEAPPPDPARLPDARAPPFFSA